MSDNNRRKFLKEFSLTVASASLSLTGPSVFAALKPFEEASNVFRSDFSSTPDRTWLGENYWSIPMEDWHVKNGRIECVGKLRNSRVNVLTSVLTGGDGNFIVSTDIGLLATSDSSSSGSAGLYLGVKDPDDENVKAACYYGKGLPIGVTLEGDIFIGKQKKRLPSNFVFSSFKLSIVGKRSSNNTTLDLTCIDSNGVTSNMRYETDVEFEGLVNIVNNFTESQGANFWFKNLKIDGNNLVYKPENSFGPILWSMHTLSKGTLNLMAQMPPIGTNDNQNIELQIKIKGKWLTEDIQPIEPNSFTAHFKISNWDSLNDASYRFKYLNHGKTHTYNGKIRSEPYDRPLKFGGLTCQHWGGYPYSPLIQNLENHNPDLLYFSGDQLYEQNGGYPMKRYPEKASILSYLGKWFMFGWAFRDLMRDIPTICTPDDHDVFQGNIWGEGGRLLPLESWKKSPDDHGGFVQTRKMINVVAKTQCGHLPKAFNSNKLYSGMDTWYTDLIYGKVSFAIISDRIFKSGPEMVRSGADRLDHIKRPLLKDELEDRNLTLLGAGQMEFLENWVHDWEGSNMKVLLSQTLFANVGTHHGPEKMFLHGDMDSGGWPKHQRDEVLRLVRKANVFHINGDQHLPFLVQYGVDSPRDGGWTFCTPAISTGYPRWGQPDLAEVSFRDRPDHGLSNTGLYEDGFGNSNYIYAVGNPLDEYQHPHRYQEAQNKASGFGLIIFDTNSRTIEMNAYRFLADKNYSNSDDQFPGWPLTISQSDNDGRKPVAYLPTLEINKPDQLVKLYEESTNELVSVWRVKGTHYSPSVFSQGPFRLEIGEGSEKKVLREIKPTRGDVQVETLQVSL